MLLKLIIWGVLLTVVYRAVKSKSGNSDKDDAREPGGFSGQVDDVMVKDPVCGTYFPIGNGVSLEQDGETLHFCSQDCRRRYLDEQALKQER